MSDILETCGSHMTRNEWLKFEEDLHEFTVNCADRLSANARHHCLALLVFILPLGFIQSCQPLKVVYLGSIWTVVRTNVYFLAS